MKKLIIATIICFAACFVGNSAKAQVLTMGGSAGAVVNTLTNYNTIEVQKSYKYIAIQTIITKVSGTVGGTVTLQGSVDGTNYETVDLSYICDSTATYTPTDVATNSKIFKMNGNPYAYYRVKYTGTGTMSATMTSYITLKP